MNCELCAGPGGELLWQDDLCRVVAVTEPGYPGFCRVIWHSHIKEMTDLPSRERDHLMAVVLAVESVLRTVMRPDKINLASFGTLVPHLHWHVVPRFRDDPHFPQPIWAAPQRTARPDNRENFTPQIKALLHDTIVARRET
jgi:diadenosine tetraphosphate (Ap4A) HIT family hydrolase